MRARSRLHVVLLMTGESDIGGAVEHLKKAPELQVQGDLDDPPAHDAILLRLEASICNAGEDEQTVGTVRRRQCDLDTRRPFDLGLAVEQGEEKIAELAKSQNFCGIETSDQRGGGATFSIAVAVMVPKPSTLKDAVTTTSTGLCTLCAV
jgi:hypothetical protein